jgi:hypothetical protein
MSKAHIDMVLFGCAVISAVGGIVKILEYCGVTMKQTAKSNTSKGTPDQRKLWVPVLLAIVALVLSAVGFYVSASSAPSIDTDNIEGHVKEWLDHFHFVVQSEPVEGTYFRRVIILPNGNRISVMRTKGERDKYLTIGVTLKTTDEEKALWDKLSDAQMADLVTRMTLEAARSKTTYSYTTKPFIMFMEKRIPITNTLTESTAIGAIEDLDSTTVAVQDIAKLGMRDYKVIK